MDPVSAFSLACGVIQVVDFSLKISSTCRKLYQNGSLSDNDVIEGWAENLEKLCGELNPPVTDGVPVDILPANEQELRNLAASCSITAHDLIHELDGLKVSGPRKKREVFKQGFRSIWKKDAIEKIQKQLDSCQKSLDTRILVYVRQLLVETSSEQKQSLRKLDARYQAIADSLLQGHRSFDELKSLVQSENAATQERISDLLRVHQNMLLEKESSQRLLDSLHFPDIHCRQEQIADAHRKTFQWIFDASPSAFRPWDNFVEWLENGKGTYWINGKLGSGKSTLMSYICQDARTSAALAKWGGIGVITPQFFFWNPGSHLQKSIEGLLRSLIYQILQERPDLAPLVASGGPLETWTDRRLHISFRRITQDSSLRRSKLCFFIDGLDEFAGDQSSLIDLLRSITDGQDVKICASSRPYIIFEEAFSSSCMLKLQDLTRSDIESYVLDNIPSLPRSHSSSLRDGQITSKIAQEIVERANGVFLWVSLAVKDQLEGIRNDDDHGTLWERLRTMPTEIEDVYAHLLNRISKFYKAETAQVLQTILQISSVHEKRGYGDPCSLLDVALSLNKGLDHILNSSADVCTIDISLQCDRTRRRLFTTCSAFLEIKDLDLDSSVLTYLRLSEQQMEPFRSGNATVDFLHRSAAEFFEMGQGREWLKGNLVTEYKTPIYDFLKVQVAKVRLLGFPLSDEIKESRDFLWFPKSPRNILYLLCEAEAELGRPPAALCSALDRAITMLHRQRQGSDQTAHWILLAEKKSLEEGNIHFGPAFCKRPVIKVTSNRPDFREIIPQSSLTRLSVTPKDVLGLWAYLGLNLYVEESIKASSSPLSIFHASYLLSCVLKSINNTIPIDPSFGLEKRLRLVGFLLNQGANPNEAAVRGTLWTLFLERMYKQRNFRLELPPMSQYLEAAWASAAKAFLAAGADTHEQSSFREGIFGNIQNRLEKEPLFIVPYLEECESELQRGTGFLELIDIRVQLSVLSCLSHCLSSAPQLPSIQEDCIGKGARCLVEISSIGYYIDASHSRITPRWCTLSKEQSDRLVPAFEAYTSSYDSSSPKFWAESEALEEQVIALYHEFFEEEERRRFPKTMEETSINDRRERTRPRFFTILGRGNSKTITET